MTFDELYDILRRRFGERILEKGETKPDPFVRIGAADLMEVCRFLRDADSLAFDFLASISGVDMGDRLDSVYHLLSTPQKHTLVLKVSVPREDPRAPSVESVWRAADWLERETYDLLGIFYDGHPDLRRILLPDDWEGHPLRKDYVQPDDYNGIPLI